MPACRRQRILAIVASDRPGFLKELKRRHVWRVAIAYAVAAWLVIQVATQVFPVFHMPDWTAQFVVLLLVIAFPVVLVFAWVYELTPEGIRRTSPADSPAARTETEHRQVGRKLNVVIITVLVLAVALLGWRVWVLQRATAPRVEPAATTATTLEATTASAPAATSAVATHGVPPPLPTRTSAIPEKSVAVLPFVNESGQANEQFFSDGLSEDLINTLSQFDGLKVISRNSAFQFRDSKDTSATIGRLLGVAHLLEGSVQRAGDEVRITATLVNAVDGSTLWSEHYDRPYKDLFALQDAITQAVSGALKAKLMTAPGVVVQSDRPPGGNLAAYTAYQHGNAYYALNNEASDHQAIDAYRHAIRIDPKYAAAYAGLSETWVELAQGWLQGKPAKEAYANAHHAADTALKIDPDSSFAHRARAFVLQTADFDWVGAEAEYRRALQLAPNDTRAQISLASALATLGQVQQAADLTRTALIADPRHAGWYHWLGIYLSALGQLDAAREKSTTAIALQPQAATYHEQLAVIEMLRGDAKAALAAAQQEPDAGWREIALALALQAGSDRGAADAAIKKLVADQASISAYQIGEAYALRRDPGAMFHWLDRAWDNRDPGVQALLYDPMILRYRADPRFAAFCRKVGLPATTDAVAME